MFLNFGIRYIISAENAKQQNFLCRNHTFDIRNIFRFQYSDIINFFLNISMQIYRVVYSSARFFSNKFP